MKVCIEGTPKEIADLVLAVQSQPIGEKANTNIGAVLLQQLETLNKEQPTPIEIELACNAISAISALL